MQSKRPWHSIDSAELLDLLSARLEGLTALEVASRLEAYGKNELPIKKPLSLLKIFLFQFKNPLIYILLIATIISLSLGEYTDAIFIIAVILINAALGTWQENKAEKSANNMQKLIRIQCVVKRNDRKIVVDAVQLVPGDIVLLESGNRVPADIRLLSTKQLQCDESLLTGESLPVEKHSSTLPENTNLTDRHNMLFAGSTITFGRGTGVVVQTGIKTAIGEIAYAVKKTESLKPPLLIRMERLTKQIGLIVLAAIISLMLIGYFKGFEFAELFFLAVALAVSAIPEGLPIAITVALAIGTLRMARKSVIIRKLTAVEGLGSCTYIASDKTGTLTVNMQTVRKFLLGDGTTFHISGEGYNDEGSVTNDNENTLIPPEVAELSIMCNEASLRKDENGNWTYQGDTMDVAMLAFAYKTKINHDYAKQTKIIDHLPFESEIKHAAIAYKNIDNAVIIDAKGASEAILPMCSHMLGSDGKTELKISEVEQLVSELSKEGFRVLALARRSLSDKFSSFENDMHDMTLLGCAAFIDPPRPEAIAAVQSCQNAGVRVAMVTGDHPLTALAIAKELHIADENTTVVSGKDLEKLEEESPEFLHALKSSTVFARVAPLQKEKIVSGLASLGHFVAVTGDGVNDVPALKKANIGIAMGSGTDIAKDVASIIITDDNFKSIAEGIKGGRQTYDNIRKVIYLLLSTGTSEIIMFFLALIAGLPLPLTAIQLLWLNLVTNGIQDKGLAFESEEDNAMKRPPRKPTEGVFNRLMISQIIISGIFVGFGGFLLWHYLLEQDYSESHARTLVFMFMVLAENFHVFNCRSETKSTFTIPFSKNWLLIIGVILAQAIHILAINIPLMQDVLHTMPVSPGEWLWLTALAFSVIPVMELFKWVYRYAVSSKSRILA